MEYYALNNIDFFPNLFLTIDQFSLQYNNHLLGLNAKGHQTL